MEILCLRHAESENAIAGASGAVPPAPLTERGRAHTAGHVGSLTLALSVLCGLGRHVWGAPLPYAVPFAVHWDGTHWYCPRWPG